MQLRGSVPPSPCVLHSRVCLAAGLPFFHYPIPVRPILWSSLGTLPCRPSTHALEQSAHCSQHRSQRGFWEQHSLPVTQHTGDSPARPCSDSGRAVLVARVAFCRSLHSGASPARVWLWGCVQASPRPGATGGFCPCTGVALPQGLLRQHGHLLGVHGPSPLGLCSWFLHNLDHLCLPGPLLLI